MVLVGQNMLICDPSQEYLSLLQWSTRSNVQKFFFRSGDTLLGTGVETFQDGVVTSEYVITSFSNSDLGSYSCRLTNDGSTVTAARDSVVLAIQGKLSFSVVCSL